ncbi:DUF1735 domain-containing protein [Mucilaginibacter terrigena]|nr:DUF1735 domain-containing protein [Mucilaginibacter terrigena]
MKRILTAIASITLMLGACKQEYKYPGGDQYKDLYMPQAHNATVTKGLLMSDTAQAILFSASYGGPGKPNGDITVNFDVSAALVDTFNMANGTTYKIMPEGSYELDKQGVIPSGGLSTGSLKVKVKTKDVLNVFESYLLPVSITTNSANLRLNSQLKTTYFLVTPSYAPGDVPRQHVLKLDNGSIKAFPYGSGANLALIARQADNNMYRFPVKADGTFDTPSTIGIGWGDVQIFIPFDDRWVIRNDAGNMWQYLWSQTGQFQGGNQVGSGWDNNDLIIGYKNNIYNRNRESKALTRWPFAGCFCGGVFGVDGNWGEYTQIIPYKNTLLGVKANGELWESQVTENGEVSGTRKVGSGWDMYTRVIPFGDALLGLDANGDVWRYEFDPKGFWALK